ncbi:hypothetical protein HZI73_02020 [Vallitalea pronyensis]|uniref:Uncharacterized protein n=1 Tax=Vallitalea pronyensis TaxID=1348613 RepID=A0A8J8MG28_9FIRM|nr:hypothetical protein [Vallitalea pronyensis]QUI21137.1 hypothetical protein HZI73_02020 [Vallitalea pronyensis]
MNKKFFRIILTLTLIFSMSMTSLALPRECPECGCSGTYKQVVVTYDVEFKGYAIGNDYFPPSIELPHADRVYDLQKYRYNICTSCFYRTEKVYFSNLGVRFSPDEPQPEVTVDPYPIDIGP